MKRLLPAFALALSNIASTACGNASTADLPKPVICEPDGQYTTSGSTDYLRKNADGTYSAINSGINHKIVVPVVESGRVIHITAKKFTAGEKPCTAPQFSLIVGNDEIKRAASSSKDLLNLPRLSIIDPPSEALLIVVSFNNAAADNKIPLYPYEFVWPFIKRVTSENSTKASEQEYDIGREFGKEIRTRATQEDLEIMKRAGGVAFYYVTYPPMP